MRPQPADTHQGQRPCAALKGRTHDCKRRPLLEPKFSLPARGPSTHEPFWATFLKSMVRRGLRGVKLVISDAHEGLKAAIRRVMGSTWQRCRVHWMRNAQSYVPKGQQSMVAAALRQAFIQPDRATASQTLRHVADQLRTKSPKLGAFIDDSEVDVLLEANDEWQLQSRYMQTEAMAELIPFLIDAVPNQIAAVPA
jgi:putative transposase